MNNTNNTKKRVKGKVFNKPFEGVLVEVHKAAFLAHNDPGGAAYVETADYRKLMIPLADREKLTVRHPKHDELVVIEEG